MSAPRVPRVLLAALAIAGLPPGASAENPNPEAARLSASESPFVRRHAGDSVHWLPWGPEAFDKARNEKKPLFVSVGYDSCHWSARMQEETFNDPAIADVLNRHFVNVLVDHVQRPDLHEVYRAYLVSVKGGDGGWPVNIWLTPEGIPFAASSYSPPASDRTTFSDMVNHIISQWTRFPQYIEDQSKRDFAALQEHINAAGALSTDSPPNARDLAMAAYEYISSRFDPVAGGFTHPAKFPQGANLRFLTHLAARETGDSFRRRQILKMLTLSARSLVDRGVFDHIDGGFHRHAIDPAWQRPRFEKTLPVQYDVVTALLDLHALAPDPLYAEAIRRTLDFTTRSLRLPSGLFQSALHSDSKSTPGDSTLTEGAAYTWTYDAFAAAVGPEDLPVLAQTFHIRPDGNLSPGTSGNPDLARVNIPRRGADAFAVSPDNGDSERAATIARGLGNLAEARARRPRPDPDTNTVTGWNALAASAFAKAYRAFGDAADLKTAETTLEALLSTRFDPATGHLVHLEHPGSEVLAFSYSATIRALLDLYDATLDPRHVKTAGALQDRQIEFFWDTDHGGFFETLADSPRILIRFKGLGNDYDSNPGTNDLAAANLRRLGDLLGDPALLERSAALLGFAVPRLQLVPGLASDFLVNALVLEREPTQVLLNAPLDSELAAATLRLLGSRPADRLAVFAIDSRHPGPGFLAARNARLRDAKAKAGSPPSVLVGRDFRFGAPLTSPEAVEKALASP